MIEYIEIWKPVVGYEGFYEVSNAGNVRSLPRNGTKKYPIILKKSGQLYDMVILQKNGVKNGKLVHRLVAQSFIPNPHNKGFVNHKDGVKRNNFLYNLEWVTRSENEIHAHKTGLKIFKREKNPNHKLNSVNALEIRYKYRNSKISQRRLASIYNVSQALINHILNNKAWA